MKQTLLFLLTLFWNCSNSNNSSNAEQPADNLPPKKTDAVTRTQVGQDSLISLLSTMKSGSLNCDADIYWKIIKRGKSSILPLIESLTDTTITNVYDGCKQGKLNVGEISYFALEEIAEFPAFIVTHKQFDLFVNDCWSFYDYLFDYKNKREYQRMVRDFYNSNKYVYSKYNKHDLTDCRKKYKIEGKYKLKQ
ncbi:MAG: hypothetical protein J0L56_17000 [Chitinophagales bacterium]|nr:hypothetical protein [Chitinophagales bacterium]